jgi:hypothetical protein
VAWNVTRTSISFTDASTLEPASTPHAGEHVEVERPPDSRWSRFREALEAPLRDKGLGGSLDAFVDDLLR